MYPTIAHGDTVLVEMPVDLDSVKVGDIVIYGSIAALAWNPNPSAMWIGHRVVEKYQQNGTWYFRTKGDYNPEPDPWKVPGCWVTGRVIGVAHATNPPQLAPESVYETSPSGPQQTSSFHVSPTQLWLAAIGGVGLLAVAAAKRVYQKLRLPPSNEISRQGCFDCRYYRFEYAYTPVTVDGRLGIRRVVNHSRGYCQYHDATIFEGCPREKCRNCERRTAE